MAKTENHILELIAAYTVGEISSSDFDTLKTWVNANDSNTKLFEAYLKLYKDARTLALLNEFDEEKAWAAISEGLQPKSKTVRLNSWYAVAASFLVLFGIGAILMYQTLPDDTTTQTLNAVSAIASPGSHNAILTLEDGRKIKLGDENGLQTNDADADGKSIVYSKTKTKSPLQYNFMTVPRGGEFSVELSDGTKVWLNSESELKYPVRFAANAPREVELLYGEAYFDVTHSSDNDGTPFRVISDGQRLEVLGTEFNISAYSDELYNYTTLLDGSVSVSNELHQVTLVPGEQAKIGVTDNSLTSYKTNVSDVISWRKGLFLFENEDLRSILNKISRWYDFEFVFDADELEDLRFSGKLRRDDEVGALLGKIQETGEVLFSVADGTVYVKRNTKN